jgi:hypothetical protein
VFNLVLLIACTPTGEVNDSGSAPLGFPGAVSDEVRHPSSTRITVAPIPASPPEGAAFDHFPRFTVLTWNDVAPARSYLVEVEYCRQGGCVDSTALRLGRAEARGNAYAFDFVGAQPGRWRVRALDSTGAAGPPSSWMSFIHKR